MDTRDEALRKAIDALHKSVEPGWTSRITEYGKPHCLFDVEYGSESLVFSYATPRQAPPKGTMVRGWNKDGSCEVFGRSSVNLFYGELTIMTAEGNAISRPCWEVLAPVKESCYRCKGKGIFYEDGSCYTCDACNND